MLPYTPNLKSFSRELRNNMTDAEQTLWRRRRNKQILGVQFYRQKPIAGFIVDFYAAAAKLVIELDGSQHFEPEHQAQDAERDAQLQKMGLVVLLFDNHKVMTELDGVLEIIYLTLEHRLD